MTGCATIKDWVKTPRERSVRDNPVPKNAVEERWDELKMRLKATRSRRHELIKWRIRVEDVAVAQLALERSFEERFLELAQRWRNEVRTVSSTTDRVLHSAYQDIIGMGKAVLPLIFRELESGGGHWFWALRHITHENPASPQDAGNIQKLTEAWLQWGREHHYL